MLVTWLDIIAEIFLGTHALADQRRIESDIFCTFHFLAEQLAGTLHCETALLAQLHVTIYRLTYHLQQKASC